MKSSEYLRKREVRARFKRAGYYPENPKELSPDRDNISRTEQRRRAGLIIGANRILAGHAMTYTRPEKLNNCPSKKTHKKNTRRGSRGKGRKIHYRPRGTICEHSPS